jgi:hypothetical protein
MNRRNISLLCGLITLLLFTIQLFIQAPDNVQSYLNIIESLENYIAYK